MMDFFRDPIGWMDGWIRDLLIEGIINSFEEAFGGFNHEVEQIAGNLGHTPSSFNIDIFNMVRSLSETVIMPIAGIVLAFVVCYELITMVIEKNNGHDFDTFIFFKWIIKTFVAIMILTNVFEITEFIFAIAQTAVQGSAEFLGAEITVDFGWRRVMYLEEALWEMSLWQLFNLQMQTGILSLAIRVMGIIVFIIIHSRMLEIYLYMAIGPIPLASITNSQYGQMGQNWLKALAALAFQAFLIMVCVAIYGVMLSTFDITDAIGFLWMNVGYTILLILMLWKTGAMSKAIFGAH